MVNKINIPNMLTIFRFLIVPIFGYYLYSEQYIISIFLFLFGGLTDVLDGYIARKYNMVTSWGKFADPIADKFLQITALVFLSINKLIPFSILIIVILKEVFMVLGSILLYKKDNYVVSANWYGKFATVIFYIAILCIIIMRVNEIHTF